MRLLFLIALLISAQEEGPAPVTQIAADAAVPSLAIDPDGGLYAVFFRNGNVEISTSTDKGKTWSMPVTAIDAAKRAVAVQHRGPRVVVDKAKRVTVTAPLPLDKGPQVDLWIAHSTDRGQTFSKPSKLNDGPITDPLHATAAGGGEVHVAWLETGKKGPEIVYAHGVDPKGKGGKTTRVAYGVCERCAPAVAVDAKGSAVFLYREGGDGKKARQMQFLSGPTAKAAQVNVVDTKVVNCPLDAPAVAVSADGKTVAAAWMDLRDGENDPNVYLAMARDGKFGRESRINDDGRFYQGRPSVGIDAEGVAWVAWEDGRTGVQRIFAGNSKVDKNFAVSGDKDPKAGHPSLVAQGAFIGVAFELGSAVAFRQVVAP